MKINNKDILLIISLCLLSGIAWFILSKDVGTERVIVTLDGQQYGVYSLYEDQKIEIKSEYGRNVIIIENQQVYVKEADCPDGYCMKQGKLPNGRGSLICLPHRLVIALDRVHSNDAIDAISG